MNKNRVLSKKNSKLKEQQNAGGIVDSMSKLIVPLGLTVAARYLSKRRKKNKKKSKKIQKGGFIRGGSDQHFYNGYNCNANK